VQEKNRVDKENRISQLKNVLFETDLMGSFHQRSSNTEKIICKQKTATKKVVLKERTITYFSRNEV
jgi:hypothetical protein